MLAKTWFAMLILAAVILNSALSHAGDGDSKQADSANGSAEVDEGRSISHSNEKLFLEHLAQDQRQIWTSPIHLRLKDAAWIAPIAGITAGLMVTDRTTESELGRGNHVSFSNLVANAGVAAFAGGSAAFYLYGRHYGDDRATETGLLSAEAALDSVAVDEVFKYAFRRDRPIQGDGTGRFFQSGGASFYSAHSTVAWSVATVVASEYPGWLSKTAAYGLATAVSMSRLTSRQHFPSDVFIGAAAGYMIGKHVYGTHHDTGIDETAYGTFVKSHPEWSSENAGTTFVPLDSWVYPAVERLIAAGLVRYQFLGLRPWTRTAVADMVKEADYRIRDAAVQSDLLSVVFVLKQEFHQELNLGSDEDNQAIRLESLYSRSMDIGGPPLNDSYHLGQTIVNDFGRPYQRGFNSIEGFTARAESGRFGFYVRGEYQHAPGAPAYSTAVEQVFSNVDRTPLQAPTAFASTDQFSLLDAYASTTILGHNISVGKQSLWWGPDQGDAMLLSDNAAPFYMLNVDRAIPLKLPSILKLLGPVRYDFIFGRLADHEFPPRPFIHGEKFSFKPTENLEFGFSRTAIFAGEGVTPLTFKTFFTSLTSTISSTTPGVDIRNSPGARHGAFDFSYRLPWVRNWLTLYSDSLVHDDISPIDAPRRAAVNPGIYLTHFPKIPKLDLRVEAVNTDPAITNSISGDFMYYESIYKDGYQNKGNLLGSWIGREGKGVQAWSTYWLSPKNFIQLSYRDAKVAKDFIREGETVNDYSVRSSFWISNQLQIDGFLQYERWAAPLLAATPQTNVTTSVQITFWPQHLNLKSAK